MQFQRGNIQVVRFLDLSSIAISSVLTSNIYFHTNTNKRYWYTILKKLKKCFKKDISMAITQNDSLLLTNSAANVWTSYRLIHKLWRGEFLFPPSQLQPLVSRDFGGSWSGHVHSVARCTALAVNIQLFGRWYGGTAQC